MKSLLVAFTILVSWTLSVTSFTSCSSNPKKETDQKSDLVLDQGVLDQGVLDQGERKAFLKDPSVQVIQVQNGSMKMRTEAQDLRDYVKSMRLGK